MLKSDIKSCPSVTDPFLQARYATANKHMKGKLAIKPLSKIYSWY